MGQRTLKVFSNIFVSAFLFLNGFYAANAEVMSRKETSKLRGLSAPSYAVFENETKKLRLDFLSDDIVHFDAFV